MAMHVYSVHAPPDVVGAEAAERMVFVKDGISWPALFVAVLWLLWHRMWLPLLFYLAFLALTALIDARLGEAAATIVAILGAILFALEANNLRRWSLGRRGWRVVGESFGHGRAEAEIRFFHGEAAKAERSAIASSAWDAAESRRTRLGLSGVPHGPRRRDEDEPGLGLFPEPEH
jgi:hypothetical protein